MKTLWLLAALVFIGNMVPAQGVSISTDGSAITDPAAMLEIKKGGLSKLRVRTNGFNDTAQLELSNFGSTAGTSYRMSMVREDGLLFSSASDLNSKKQDSIFSMYFNNSRTFFGMNVKTPNSLFHLHDPTTTTATMRITHSTTGSTGARGLQIGLSGTGAFILNQETGSLNFGTGNFYWGGFNSSGNFGLGTFTPTEKLQVLGNMRMISDKGIIMDAQDRPIVTRGWDVFSSGNYNGLGRWGMFMEPNRLTLGVPALPGKAIEFAKYNTNSTRETLLTVTSDGEVNTPPTGSANMLPVAFGNVAANGTILNGTGNFTVTVVATRVYDVVVTGHTLTDNNTTAIITVTTDGQGTLGHWLKFEGGKMRVIISTTTEVYPRNFSFVVYKP